MLNQFKWKIAITGWNNRNNYKIPNAKKCLANIPPNFYNERLIHWKTIWILRNCCFFIPSSPLHRTHVIFFYPHDAHSLLSAMISKCHLVAVVSGYRSAMKSNPLKVIFAARLNNKLMDVVFIILWTFYRFKLTYSLKETPTGFNI